MYGVATEEEKKNSNKLINNKQMKIFLYPHDTSEYNFLRLYWVDKSGTYTMVHYTYIHEGVTSVNRWFLPTHVHATETRRTYRRNEHVFVLFKSSMDDWLKSSILYSRLNVFFFCNERRWKTVIFVHIANRYVTYKMLTVCNVVY